MLALACLCGLLAGSARAADPSAITLSSNVLVENDPAGVLVGLLAAVDADAGDSHTFALVAGPGSKENYVFETRGNQLTLQYGVVATDGEFFDFETQQQAFSCRIKATDSTGKTCEQVFTFVVMDDRYEDADGDGLSEAEEEDLYGTSDVQYDVDGDGFGDRSEILGDSSPFDGTAWPDYPLVSWGDDADGVLRVPDSAPFCALSTGQAHTLALTSAGTVVAWGGYNDYGQNNVPAGLDHVVAVAAGGDYWAEDSGHSLALKADGTVVSWGYKDDGIVTLPAGLNDVVGIAAGWVHGLALKRDGTVVAWGGNFYDQTSVPVGLDGVVAISAGGFYNLALKGDGTVVAWGKNFNGALWEDMTVPEGLCDVVAISAGRFHCMALKSNGTVVAWGYGLDGQAAVPAGLNQVVAIAAGGFHSLALKNDGSVVAWGLNTEGQTTVPLSARSQVKIISAGLFHSFALRDTPGLAGISSPASVSATPGVAVAHQIVVANAVASHFSAVGLPAGLTLDPLGGLLSGTVSGAARRTIQILVDTNRGRLSQTLWLNVFTGLPPSSVSLSPAVVVENSADGVVVGSLTAVDPEAGDSHVFQLVSGEGSADNASFFISGNQLVTKGKLARDFEQHPGALSIRIRARDASLNPREEIIAVQFLDDRQEDADGDNLVEADEEDFYGTSDLNYDSDGDGFGDGFERDRGTSPANAANFPSGQILIAWGSAENGQTTVPQGMGEIVALSAGWAHNLALKTNGNVVAWGGNDNGQCSVPAGLANVVAVEAGGSHSMVLGSTGTVTAWGGNGFGQATVPANLGMVVAIAAGKNHSLALMQDGTVAAWGNNDYAQASVPPGLANVVAISAGDYHSVALKSDGSVVAWGANGSGGDAPAGLERIVGITAGGLHSVSLKNDGKILAWGDNQAGQRTPPPDLGGVLDLVAGWLHGIVLKQDRTVGGWGSNSHGQSNVPVEARDIQIIAAGGNHNLVLRQTAGFPQITRSAEVVGWPGQAISHQVVVTGATPVHFSAMGLPADLALDPTTGLISGTVITGQRRVVRISVDTDKGRLSRMLWLNTADGKPPTSITLAGAVSLPENSPQGTPVGTLGAIDPDAGDSHTFQVWVTSGSSDAVCLEALGTQLVVRSAAGLDFEASGGSLTIRVRAYDSAMNSCEQNFTLTLSNDRSEDADGDGMSQATEEDILFTQDNHADLFASSDADRDGVSTLVEYAFNLNPQAGDAGRHLGGPGSNAGLPLIYPVVDGQGIRRLRIEYLRRIGGGLTYLPEFSGSLGTWEPATQTVQIIPLSPGWERCVIDDSSFAVGPRFGRIRVSH